MTDTEAKRLDLYNRLQKVLGTDPATTLMTYLPPIRTDDLLTREDSLSSRMRFVNSGPRSISV